MNVLQENFSDESYGSCLTSYSNLGLRIDWRFVLKDCTTSPVFVGLDGSFEIEAKDYSLVEFFQAEKKGGYREIDTMEGGFRFDDYSFLFLFQRREASSARFSCRFSQAMCWEKWLSQ